MNPNKEKNMTTTDTPTTIGIDALQDQIRAGLWDDDIRQLAHTAKWRVKVVESNTARSFEVGQRVKIDALNIKPKYLFGMTGTVIAAKAGKSPRLSVQLDEQHREQAYRYVDHEGVIEGAPTLFSAED
jgi:hypothetical protein